MNRRRLGRTGLEVGELALGGLFISDFGGVDVVRAGAAVRCALDLGVNYLDTAPSYANSEEVLGKVLASVQTPLILSTKLGGRPHPFDPKNKNHLRQSVRESLRLLGRERIDILMVHEPDRSAQHDWWTDPAAVYGPVVDILDELREEGLIRFTGLGGTTAYEMARVVESGRFDVLLTAFNYSLLWREAERVLIPAARRQGMGIIIGSPLQQGALAVKWPEIEAGAPWLSPPRREQIRALYALADDAGLSIPELALRFVVSNPNISCLLTGVRSEREVQENVHAVEKGPLPADLLARLDEIAATVPMRPFEEPALLPFGRAYKGPGPLR